MSYDGANWYATGIPASVNFTWLWGLVTAEEAKKKREK